ncbi:S9 family peptidase [Opitutus sp. GAS368]|uniref:S9 family peptidase n=1 Tax=Opitutus sp. GAS368 TaxID=1882749 RepID=UPI00087944F6|nr:S9 family peptidase [Opitutus sp. GAS368]SDS58744.1 oligopeptidase B Serine peptidase. MEROPS family S09A [Opitutus sp. GAS368]
MLRLLVLMCALTVSVPAFDLVNPKPPVAAKKPKDVTVHEDKRIDDYFWLREKGQPEVVNYLEQENAYTEAVLAPAKELRAALYKEMVGRIKEDDSSAPVPFRGYAYYTRTEKDRQYPIYCRKGLAAGAAEEILLDLNKMIGTNTYISVGQYHVSDDGTRLAYAVDWTGYRQYEVFVMDLATKALIPQAIGKVASLEWGAGHDVLYYVTENDSKRSDKLHRWTLSTGKHELLYEDKDELFNLDVQKSRDNQFIFCLSESKLTTEVFALPAVSTGTELKSLLGRTENVKYFAEHRAGKFYYVTNRDGAKNYKVAAAPDTAPAQLADIIPHNPAIKVEEFDMFAGHMVVTERENGLPHLRVYDFATGRSKRLEMPDAAYEVGGDRNWEFDTTEYRFNYQSLARPPTVYAANLTTGARTLIKQTEVLGGFAPKNYKSERLWAVARDGTKVPLSIVYRADLDRTKPQPLWLYGYGSYGISLPVSFSSSRVSLLDRGVIYVIAHIRGGGELGEEWREAGRMEKKMNTFNDFVDCAQWLVDRHWTTPKQLVTSGGSAGGLLMGAVLNQRPDLFAAAIVQVPFVDVLNTMLDATLPLTTEEYIEWGNPNIKEQYFWMRAYSPYDNLKKAAYPNLLVNVSYNDSQVPYWEGTKYLAKLRTLDTGHNATLLHATMGAGHGGAAGRYDALNDVARNYAFFLQALGMSK